jgi:hypothetical protein
VRQDEDPHGRFPSFSSLQVGAGNMPALDFVIAQS